MRRIVLNFHGIGTPDRALEPGEAPYWISRDLLVATLDLAAVHADAVRVDVTFDDGNASDLAIGAEELGRRGIAATFFVLSARIGMRGALSAEDIRTLSRQGHGIGSHGADHVAWKGLDAAGEQREFVQAREEIAAALGAPVTMAAIPFGRYDRRVLTALRRHGYQQVFSSDGGAVREGAFPVPRTSIRRDMSMEHIESLITGREPPARRLRRRLAMAIKKRI